MDVNMDRVIQLRTGDNNPNFILNITAFPAPESFEWWSDGQRTTALKHRVLSSTKHFHQVALQLNAVNHSFDGNHNHSLRIKHPAGHRFIKVVVRDGTWEDDRDVDSAGNREKSLKTRSSVLFPVTEHSQSNINIVLRYLSLTVDLQVNVI